MSSESIHKISTWVKSFHCHFVYHLVCRLIWVIFLHLEWFYRLMGNITFIKTICFGVVEKMGWQNVNHSIKFWQIVCALYVTHCLYLDSIYVVSYIYIYIRFVWCMTKIWKLMHISQVNTLIDVLLDRQNTWKTLNATKMLQQGHIERPNQVYSGRSVYSCS